MQPILREVRGQLSEQLAVYDPLAAVLLQTMDGSFCSAVSFPSVTLSVDQSALSLYMYYVLGCTAPAVVGRGLCSTMVTPRVVV